MKSHEFKKKKGSKEDKAQIQRWMGCINVFTSETDNPKMNHLHLAIAGKKLSRDDELYEYRIENEQVNMNYEKNPNLFFRLQNPYTI